MSEEEKKAIEELKLLCDDILKDDNCDRYDQYSPLEKMTLVSIILNLITKQQEEINNSVSKDKIRDKINEILNIQNKCVEITFDEIILKLEELLEE